MMKPGFAALACLALVACTAPEPAAGKLAVALTAPGPDGSIYRLPASTFVALDSGAFSDLIVLDGASSTLSIDVPPGTYTAELQGNLFADGVLPLERTLIDGSVQTAYARLTSANPASVTVSAGLTSALRYDFQTAGGTLSFAQGSLDIDVHVTEVGADGADTSFAALASTTQVTVHRNAPAALIASLPAVGDRNANVTVVASLSGAWAQLGVDTVCAPAAVSFRGADGSARVGLRDLVSETLGGEANVCVDRATPQVVSIGLSREGAPTTGTFTGLGQASFFYAFGIHASLPVSVLDGHLTLDLDAFAGRRALPGTVTTTVFADDASETWYRATHTGTVTVEIRPTP